MSLEDSSTAHKVDQIYLNVPIQVTITNTPVGAMTLKIKRSWRLNDVYAAVCEKMAALQKDNGEYLPNNRLSLGDGFNIKDGDTLDFALNIPRAVPVAGENEDNMGVLVRGFDGEVRTVTVPNTCTVSELKLRAANIHENYLLIHQHAEPLRLENLRLLLHGRSLGPPLDEDENMLLTDLPGYTDRYTQTFSLIVREPAGMPKKGALKVKKAEKLRQSQAKAQYSLTQPIEEGATQACEEIASRGFIEQTIRKFALDNPESFAVFADAAYETTRSDQLMKVCCKYLVKDTLEKLQAEITKAENTMKAVYDSFEMGFIDNYYEDKSYVTDPLFALLSEVDPRPEEQRANYTLGHDDEEDMDL